MYVKYTNNSLNTCLTNKQYIALWMLYVKQQCNSTYIDVYLLYYTCIDAFIVAEYIKFTTTMYDLTKFYIYRIILNI